MAKKLSPQVYAKVKKWKKLARKGKGGLKKWAQNQLKKHGIRA